MVRASLLLLVIDQSLKLWLVHSYPELVSYNSGVAFGLGNGLFVALGLMLLLWSLWQARSLDLRLWLALALASCSNLIDRWRVGAVIDYLKISHLTVNLADLWIVGLVAWLGYRWLMTESNAKPKIEQKPNDLVDDSKKDA